MSDSQLLREIEEQPAALERLIGQARDEVIEAASKIREFGPQWVVIAARGTSDNAARYAQYLFGAHNRLGVGLAVPSLHTLYESPPDLSRALTIGISQSGQSPDVVSVVEEARNQGGLTLAVTNEVDSPLAAAGASIIRLAAEEEKSIAATKTYTNQLLALALLSAALEFEAGRWDEVDRVPERVSQSLKVAGDMADRCAGFAKDDHFVVLGRGFNYCTAFEVALKMKETSYVLAEPYSVADLLHGPVAMIDEGFPVIMVAPSGKAADNSAEFLSLAKERGARVVAISDIDDITGRADAAIPLPQDVPEWLSPIVSIVPGQLWARSLAVAKGIDPDSPRGLSKVTLTH